MIRSFHVRHGASSVSCGRAISFLVCMYIGEGREVAPGASILLTSLVLSWKAK